MSTKTDTRQRPAPQALVGTVHRFGENGVLYEVVRLIDDTSAGIRVSETEEETAYPIADILQDPAE